MAGTFADMKTDLVSRVVNSHPSTGTFIANAIVDQLLTVQPEATIFMEVSGSFTTTGNQVAYDSATTGFPKSLLRFDRLYYDLGSYTIDLVNTDRAWVLRLQELGAIAYPYQVAWIGGKLNFGPPPADAYTVKWAGMLDATKDKTTGEAINTTGLNADSSAQTNPWFTEGAVVLRNLALAQYYLQSPDQRSDLAANHQQAAAQAITSLRQAQAERLQLGGIYQIPSAFVRRLPESERRQLIFPGVPI